MDRRQVLTVGAVALGTGLIEKVALGAEKGKIASKESLKEQVARAAAECMRTGEACLSHCNNELAKGNKDMAKCAKTLSDLLATCGATLRLASNDSSLFKAMAAVCADSCKACKEACAEHKAHFAHGMHLICKTCMESCEECETLCRKV